MFRRCVFTFVLVLIPAAALAAPHSASWLLMRMAEEASANARTAGQSGKTEDAKTWREWETLWRNEARLPEAQSMSAVTLTERGASDNTNSISQAERVGDTRKAAFFRASRTFWHDVENQLQGGGELSIRFPALFLTPVAGLEGTPWAASTPARASASDCAAIAAHVRACEAQIAQIEHENGTGLYSDQSDVLIVRQAQCHRWEEAQVAYCRR